MNYGGALRAVFRPVGFRKKGLPADGAAAGVLVLEYLRFQRPGQRQDSPPKPLAADRKGNRLRAGVGVAIVKGDTSPVVVIAALPANEGIGLLALPRCHPGQRPIHPPFYGRQVLDTNCLSLFSVGIRSTMG